MSLAEELLADLEDDEEALEEAIEATHQEAEEKEEEAMHVEEDHGEEAHTVQQVAKLYNSTAFKSVIDRIETFSTKPRSAAERSGPVEADPEYRLIVDANNLAAEIDDDITNLYKFGKDKYSQRFPELETLVVQPLEYLMAARELGNDVLKAKNNAVLEQFLTQATIMVVSVTASTTQG